MNNTLDTHSIDMAIEENALSSLLDIRARIADRQRRLGVMLADTIRMQIAANDLFTAGNLTEHRDSLLDKIEDYTQRLIALDEEIDARTEKAIPLFD